MEGPLCKWTNVMKGWQYRYFVLDYNQALLSYYTSKEKMIKGDRRGCVRLKGAVIGIDDEDDSTFTITVDGKMFHFQAHDAEDRSKWVSALEDTILRHTHRRRPKKSDSSQIPTLNDFERKLTETDAYLQLLINQIADLNLKIENATTENDKEKLVDIKAKTLTLLDGVKHTIVLLQIAKNTVHPVNGLIDDNKNEAVSQQTTPKNLPSVSQSTKDRRNSSASRVVTLEASKKEESLKLESDLLNLNGVPETSYSSSDDEEFFYDASEETPGSTNIDIATKSIDESSGDSDKPAIMNRSKIDYDSLYDDDDEEDLGSIEGHGSVISHLISQVKIGMDLTKVVLPTFILERRSLLEMYADFFAHPDLFISIADYETPEERFIQVVRWYLSAFHAGRKSSVAKKPYNPVLGEIFRCYWDIPNTSQQNSRTIADGPVPWAKSDNLAFIAEQVSHHPPISAFYAEHFEKKIMCSAHIYTKSKFLGLSIGVHNIGQGSIYLLDRGEEYTCTFPSAYGRSILTVPWVELGGAVAINCPQTGYSANIEFLTKPFYGGKKHRICGEILNSSKKPIMSINGEWNGVMYAKKSNGKTEVFVDTKSMKIIKKNVKSINEQEPFESRRLWKDVTVALKLQDVIAATNAKSAVEQKQRDLVKERQESGVKWENRVFHQLGEHWNYNTPLTRRLSTRLQ
ncbi:oxysterol-binding protein-related protein 9-like isoform X3 [Dinothrombium tinctorium]|uniref:Oxysterol-binding protein n=2 Tax=Dinothrombium tinctorium TaxID=1965070 RepID=A0A443RJN0_9ACAR|nr:oxysterol-binding protein-related protein 9-like isoform X3 [Dinothrombium tinctorium]